jgi:hypothetical protein
MLGHSAHDVIHRREARGNVLHYNFQVDNVVARGARDRVRMHKSKDHALGLESLLDLFQIKASLRLIPFIQPDPKEASSSFYLVRVPLWMSLSYFSLKS